MGCRRIHALRRRQSSLEDLRRIGRACHGDAVDLGRRTQGCPGGGRGPDPARRPHPRRIPAHDGAGCAVLPKCRTRLPSARVWDRSADQDRRQLRRTHALDHRGADAPKSGSGESGRGAPQRHPGLGTGRPPTGPRERSGCAAGANGGRPCQGAGTGAGADYEGRTDDDRPE